MGATLYYIQLIALPETQIPKQSTSGQKYAHILAAPNNVPQTLCDSLITNHFPWLEAQAANSFVKFSTSHYTSTSIMGYSGSFDSVVDPPE